MGWKWDFRLRIFILLKLKKSECMYLNLIIRRGLLFSVATAAMCLGAVGVSGQGMAVNTSGAAAHASAMLDVTSTTQGVLVPRMTASQRGSISSPATGLLVYQTDATAGFYFYNGSAWASLSAASGAAGGDLSGSYPNPSLAASGVTSGTYGSGSQVPAISVDAKGRVTSASNTSISIAGSAITSGTVATARLGSGTASPSTYLRGDGQWATPSGGSSSGISPTVCGRNLSNANIIYFSPTSAAQQSVPNGLSCIVAPVTCTPAVTAYSYSNSSITWQLYSVTASSTSNTYTTNTLLGSCTTAASSSGVAQTCTMSISSAVAAGTLMTLTTSGLASALTGAVTVFSCQ